MASQKQPKQLPFFVIEGNNGVGKTTQLSRLRVRLESEGYSVCQVKFPRYDSPGGHFAKHYLDGSYGSLDEIGPKLSSVLFAVDRFDFKLDLEAVTGSGRLVLADRYLASNLAHQGSKIDDPDQRREFFEWLVDFEYGLLGVPRPAVNLILLVDEAVSRRLRASRARTVGPKSNIHASDDHQAKTYRVYKELCQLFPAEFIGIDCQDGGQLKSEEEIANLIYAAIKPFLGAVPSSSQPGKRRLKLNDEEIEQGVFGYG